MKIKKMILLAVFFFMLVGSASAATLYVDPGADLNDAMKYAHDNNYDTVYLKDGIFEIDETVYMYGDVAIRGTGTIKLESNAGWGADVPMISARSGETSGFTIEDITIDGNARGQPVPFGKGYYTMIEFYRVSNVLVNNVNMVDGNNDGLCVRFGTNIAMTNCTVDQLGHDAGYFLYSKKVLFYNNDVSTRTNSACRISSGSDVLISHNNIYSEAMDEGSSTGPGIEIDIDGSSEYTDDIEICYNNIHNLRASAMWITSGNKNGKGVYIHNNIIRDVGTYSSYNGRSNAGVALFQYNGTIIENNVFDDAGIAAVMHAQSTDPANNGDYSTVIRNNIIINIDNKLGTLTAEPIKNTYSKNHKFFVYNNDFYNNYDAFDGQEFYAWRNFELSPAFADSSYHLKDTSLLLGQGYNGQNIGVYARGNEIIGTLDSSEDDTPLELPDGDTWLIDNSTYDYDGNTDVDNSTSETDDDCNTDLDNGTYDYDDRYNQEGSGNDCTDGLIDNSTTETDDGEDDGYLDDNENSDLVDNSTTDVDNSTASTKKHHRSGKSYNLASYASGTNTVALTNATMLKPIVGIAYSTTPTYVFE